jgi:hypothetical protein
MFFKGTLTEIIISMFSFVNNFTFKLRSSYDKKKMHFIRPTMRKEDKNNFSIPLIITKN